VPSSQNYLTFLKSFNSSKFRELWPAQDYVLAKYSDEYVEKPDIAIELPTGAGKTLIALLVTESWRQEAKKVAIL
jgi:replicative superfamily II helicase